MCSGMGRRRKDSETYSTSGDEGDDPDRLFLPIWMDQPRGFVDFPSKAAAALEVFLSAHLSREVKAWSCNEQNWVFRLHFVKIELVTSASGLSILAASKVLPRKWLDPLRCRLRVILQATLRQPSWTDLGFGVMLLQLVEEAAACDQDWRKLFTSKAEGYDARAVADWEAVVGNTFGVDLSTVDDAASYILGTSIAEIFRYVPPYMRILHAEPVFRNDLVRRFLTRQHEIRKDLENLTYTQLRASISRQEIRSGAIVDTKEGLVDAHSQPRVTFHGTSRHVVSSIVRHGFLERGTRICQTDDSVEVAYPVWFALGIYSSPDPWYASLYSTYTEAVSRAKDPSQVPGFRLIICATLMGRPFELTRDQARRRPGLLHPDAHSHVSPNQKEYVVFNSAQIIPCYVLHIDYGAEEAKKAFDEMPEEAWEVPRATARDIRHETAFQDEDTSPGALKAKKEARKAAAKKWFPYGYGPATGTSFVVEEVGEISDDEEDYGEFQHERNESEEHQYQAADDKGDQVISWFDEYQTVRMTKRGIT